jgi:hypothetical protein
MKRAKTDVPFEIVGKRPSAKLKFAFKIAGERTPFVLKTTDEHTDVNPAENKFSAIPVTNGFDSVFSVYTDARTETAAAQSPESRQAANVLPVQYAKRNVRKADKLIIPSMKTASTPAYSLINAPAEASIRGTEETKIFKMILMLFLLCQNVFSCG